MKDYILYSGGAIGSDRQWNNIGKMVGLEKAINFIVGSLDICNSDFLNQIEEAYMQAAKDLGRPTLFKESYGGKLVRRDYLQAFYADAVYAIGNIINPGSKDKKGYINKTNHQIVSGGTGYCVQMAINMNKSVYVFNQLDNNWYKWNDSIFELIECPVLTKKFAGIGTREITLEGIEAIKNIYNKTLKQNL